ncbi:MAG: hypothetical protein EON48_06780 [Acetobacteraceae bacterium]|nr:MAG: hypothetical protein EON48_06780 [Acetobacteraceae bacterium]
MAPRTPKDPQAKPAKAAKPAKTKAVQAEAPVAESSVTEAQGSFAAAGQVRVKELIEGIVASTGGKKADVKAVVEATLAAIGEALATGKALVVPPLGKLRVVKNKGPALTLKLRLADGAKAAGLSLADDGEDG